jgi:hypothetical protein
MIMMTKFVHVCCRFIAGEKVRLLADLTQEERKNLIAQQYAKIFECEHMLRVIFHITNKINSVDLSDSFGSYVVILKRVFEFKVCSSCMHGENE